MFVFDWTLFFSLFIVILCLYLIIISQRFFICPRHTLRHFIAICPVCERFAVADNGLKFNKNVADYWCDKAVVHFSCYPAIQKLRRKLFGIESNQSGVSNASVALLNELKNKPNDSSTNIKLLNFYKDNGRLLEAYNRAFQRKIDFAPNLFWYESCVQICKLYKIQFPVLLDEEFYGNYLTALERTLALSVQDVKMPYNTIQENVALLASFDELLYEATNLKNSSEQFLRIVGHMRGQLYFSIALIFYRKAKQDDNWAKMIKFILPLLLFSTVKCTDIREEKKEGKFSQILYTCIPVSIYRFQQAGYVLTTVSAKTLECFAENIRSLGNWKQRVCEILYNSSNYKNVLKASAFMEFDEILLVPENFPEYHVDDVNQFLSISSAAHPTSLHHFIWTGVQYLLEDTDSICHAVLPLKFSVKFTNNALKFLFNFSSSYAKNFPKIDVEAFLFACVYCAKSSFDRQTDKNKPIFSNILPADVSKLLCSVKQDLWWSYFIQTITEGHCSEEMKFFIQQGIDNIRLIEPDVLPLQLLVLLGRTFAHKAVEYESKNAQALNMKRRSCLYWKAAVPLLQNPLRQGSRLTSSSSMFEYQGNITRADAAKLISEGKRFVKMFEMKQNDDASSAFLNTNVDECNAAASTSFSEALQPSHSIDDASLKTLLEQNTLLMDKLEKLMSSNQVEKTENMSVLLENSYLESTNEQCTSHTASLMTCNLTSSMPDMATNSLRNSPCIHSLHISSTTSIPEPSLSRASLRNVEFSTGTKESYSTTNWPIVSACLFNTNIQSAATSAQNSSTLSSSVPLNEPLNQNVFQAFKDSCENTFSKSTTPSEILPTTSTTSLFHKVTASPMSVSDKKEQKPKDCTTVNSDPMVDVEPTFQLPDEMEDEEEILFENRARLYHFVDEEPIEQGSGLLKILEHKVKGRVRILMRRDIWQEIYVNHFVTENMYLIENGDRTWAYFAVNFTNKENRFEKLCVKFETTEIANEFYRIFNENKTTVMKMAVVEKLFQPASVSSPISCRTTPVSQSLPVVSIADGAKENVISLSMSNLLGAQKTSEASRTGFGDFRFEAKPILNSMPEENESVLFDNAGKTPHIDICKTVDELNNLSSSVVTLSAPTCVKSDKTTPQLFGSFVKTVDFSDLSNKADDTGFLKNKDFKGFVGAGSPLFGATHAQTDPAERIWLCPLDVIPKPSPKQSNTRSNTAGSLLTENDEGEYTSTVESNETIPRPALVEVKTGEEGLDVLYENECTLFRFTEDEWKERGFGIMKILRNPKDSTIRLLMRRYVVLEVCCNQQLTTSHELKKMTSMNKAWAWIGKDFSEGEPKNEFLCVRFKTTEQAICFKKAFDSAKSQLPMVPIPNTTSTTTAAASPSLAEMLENFLSRWKCKTCHVANKKERMLCVACRRPKDGALPSDTGKTSNCKISGESLNFSSNPQEVTTMPITSTSVIAVTASDTTMVSVTPTSVTATISVVATTSVTASTPITGMTSAAIRVFGVTTATTSAFTFKMPTSWTVANFDCSTVTYSSQVGASCVPTFTFLKELKSNNIDVNCKNEIAHPLKSNDEALKSIVQTKCATNVDTGPISSCTNTAIALSYNIPVTTTWNKFSLKKPTLSTVAKTPVSTTANLPQNNTSGVPSFNRNFSSTKSFSFSPKSVHNETKLTVPKTPVSTTANLPQNNTSGVSFFKTNSSSTKSFSFLPKSVHDETKLTVPKTPVSTTANLPQNNTSDVPSFNRNFWSTKSFSFSPKSVHNETKLTVPKTPVSTTANLPQNNTSGVSSFKKVPSRKFISPSTKSVYNRGE